MDIDALLKKVGEEAKPMAAMKSRHENRYVVAHMDGDYAAYFCAGSANCSAGEARRNVLSRIDRLRTASGAGHVIMHLTHGASSKGERFLAANARPYQGQRNHGVKPRQWQFLREWMESYDGAAFTPMIWKDREADDGIALACHTAASLRGLLHVVHTADKDMRMFCGTHVSWKEFATTDVPLHTFDLIGEDGEQYGHKWFWLQMLKGDTADNIPGLPGVGDVAASKLLSGVANNAEAYEVVAGAYINKFGWSSEWEDYFVEQAVLLWMRTDQRATLRNFLSLMPFPSNIVGAVLRLEDRVRRARVELRRLQE